MGGFPRMLFLCGREGEPRLVHSGEEEAQARADGWATFGQTPAVSPEARPAPPQKRRGRTSEGRG